VTKELVIYSRTLGCPGVHAVKRLLAVYEIAYRELYIDEDNAAREWLSNWVGFLSVPTLVMANAGENTPFEEPAPLTNGQSPRGVDRGTVITEPTNDELAAWLRKYGLMA
jgi:glutaredoxin